MIKNLLRQRSDSPYGIKFDTYRKGTLYRKGIELHIGGRAVNTDGKAVNQV